MFINVSFFIFKLLHSLKRLSTKYLYQNKMKMTEIVSDFCTSILCSVEVTKTGGCLWSNILVISKLRTYLWLHTAFKSELFLKRVQEVQFQLRRRLKFRL